MRLPPKFKGEPFGAIKMFDKNFFGGNFTGNDIF